MSAGASAAAITSFSKDHIVELLISSGIDPESPCAAAALDGISGTVNLGDLPANSLLSRVSLATLCFII